MIEGPEEKKKKEKRLMQWGKLVISKEEKERRDRMIIQVEGYYILAEDHHIAILQLPYFVTLDTAELARKRKLLNM